MLQRSSSCSLPAPARSAHGIHQISPFFQLDFSDHSCLEEREKQMVPDQNHLLVAQSSASIAARNSKCTCSLPCSDRRRFSGLSPVRLPVEHASAANPPPGILDDRSISAARSRQHQRCSTRSGKHITTRSRDCRVSCKLEKPIDGTVMLS